MPRCQATPHTAGGADALAGLQGRLVAPRTALCLPQRFLPDRQPQPAGCRHPGLWLAPAGRVPPLPPRWRQLGSADNLPLLLPEACLGMAVTPSGGGSNKVPLDYAQSDRTHARCGPASRLCQLAFPRRASHAGRTAGLEGEAAHYERLDELPFDFVRRRLSVVLQVTNRRHWACLLLQCLLLCVLHRCRRKGYWACWERNRQAVERGLVASSGAHIPAALHPTVR